MLRACLLAATCAVAIAACATAEHNADAPPAADAPIDGGADAQDDGRPDAALDAMPDACAPSAELCNGLSDDCDVPVDEDFPTLGDPCTAGIGACQANGVEICDGAGTGTTCNAVPGTPGTELCNAIDDDCDTGTDEGFAVGAACDGADGDLCNEGTVMCNGAGAAVCSDATATNVETCNSADDDCDGTMDEGLGLGTACDGADGDLCSEGVRVCGGGGAVVCNDTTATNAESCNGLDEDCDTVSDEGFPVGASCTVGVGACARTGSRICSTDGTTTVCNATPGTPGAEYCGDGSDDDCNGVEPTCPGNDLPGGAVNISSGGTFNVDLTYAHDDDANTTLGCGLTGGRDVFYQFTLGATEVVYAATFGSSYDTVIRIYDGACPTRTGTPRCDDDAGVCVGLQSQLATQLVAGTYCLVVDQYSGAQTTGATTLAFVRGGRPGTLLATGTGLSLSGSTAGLSSLATATCQASSAAPDIGYYFLACPATSMTVSANTCNAATTFDTILLINANTGAGSALGGLACNDDYTDVGQTCASSNLRSTIGPTAVGGPGLFWLVLDGYLTNSGAYQITYSLN